MIRGGPSVVQVDMTLLDETQIIKTLLLSPSPPPLLLEVLGKLDSPRERSYIALYCGLNGAPRSTYKAIGQTCYPPISVTRVSQVIAKGFRSLTKAYKRALAYKKHAPRTPTPQEITSISVYLEEAAGVVA